jgi:hypothetical protein
MKMADKLTPALEGIFTLNIIDRDNRIVKAYNDHNLIVNKSKQIIATLLGGTGGPITKIGLGIGTTEAAITDTSLSSPAYYSFTSVEYPEFDIVKFNWYVGYDQLIGVAITEFGLFTADDNLFCRRVYSAINKNADLALTGAWSIKLYTA